MRASDCSKAPEVEIGRSSEISNTGKATGFRTFVEKSHISISSNANSVPVIPLCCFYLGLPITETIARDSCFGVLGAEGVSIDFLSRPIYICILGFLYVTLTDTFGEGVRTRNPNPPTNTPMITKHLRKGISRKCMAAGILVY